MSESKPTRREADVLAFVLTWQAVRKMPPTIKEIAEGMGVRSIGFVHQCLLRLRQKGFVSWESGKSRTIVARKIAKGK